MSEDTGILLLMLDVGVRQVLTVEGGRERESSYREQSIPVGNANR
jgi:hypothetical protein